MTRLFKSLIILVCVAVSTHAYANSVYKEGLKLNHLTTKSRNLKPKKSMALGDLVYNANGYYEIRSAADMQKLSQIVKDGETCEGKRFKVTAPELDFSGLDFSSIGFYVDSLHYNKFAGEFDGQGTRIKNLHQNVVNEILCGLFGLTSYSAVIKNIVVDKSCHFNGYAYVGAIVGYNMGTIYNCKNYADIQGAAALVGGIAGYCEQGAAVANCINKGSVVSTGYGVGGIVGFMQQGCSVKNAVNTGMVKSEAAGVGGIAGVVLWGCQINDCTNRGSVGTVSDSAGGIAGDVEADNQISCCENSGEVSGGEAVGGIVGNLYRSTTDSCIVKACSVKGESYVGAVVGWNDDGILAENRYSPQTVVDMSGTTYQSAVERGVGEKSEAPHDVAELAVDGVVYTNSALLDSSIEEDAPRTFYIYRNDGAFNAFFTDEVERIDYSCEDLEGTRHDQMVTQLVYTQDSVYKIPVAAIDSVSFVCPQTVINKDVFPLTPEHEPFILAGDTISFVMKLERPGDMRPQAGHIVVSDMDVDIFPDGIMARVVGVTQQADGFHYACEQVTLDDVIDQIMIIGEVEAPEDESNVKAMNSEADNALELVNLDIWNIAMDLKVSTSKGANKGLMAFKFMDKANGKVLLKKTPTSPLYLQMDLSHELAMNYGCKFHVEGKFEPDPVQLGKTMKLKKISLVPGVKWLNKRVKLDKTLKKIMKLLWIRPMLSFHGYYKANGSLDSELQLHYNNIDKVTFEYVPFAEDHFNCRTKPAQPDCGLDRLFINMKGSEEVGLITKLFFSFNGTNTGFGGNLKAGLQYVADFVYDETDLTDDAFYTGSLNSTLTFHIPTELSLYANLGLGKYNQDEIEKDAKRVPFAYDWLLGTYYLFPTFSNLRYDNNTITMVVNRRLGSPVETGIQVLDTEGEVVLERMTGEPSSEYDNTIQDFALTGLTNGETYSVRPVVKMGAVTFPASPGISFLYQLRLCPDDNHPHMIDLGLPSGTKWACCNVGASKPEEYGNYYAWGETHTKDVYNRNTYQYYDQDKEAYIYIGDDIAGTQYDAAAVNWGAPWRMPSSEQIKELLNNCTSVWTKQNGVWGRKFTGPNGASIFLPAAGYVWDGGLLNVVYWGDYWSSTPYDEDIAYNLDFSSGLARWHNAYNRGSGRSVRPVR